MKASEIQDIYVAALKKTNAVAGGPTFDAVTNHEVIADRVLSAAVLKIGRTQAVAFNREMVTFTLTANDGEYPLGDLFDQYPAVWNLQYLFLTDSPGVKCHVVDPGEFGAYARGSTQTGKPKYCTLHSKKLTLEFWPKPDSAYNFTCYAKENLSKLNQIPDTYHDQVLNEGLRIIHAITNASMANKLALEGQEDLQEDAAASSAPTIARSGRHLGRGTSGGTRGSDSYSITGSD